MKANNGQITDTKNRKAMAAVSKYGTIIFMALMVIIFSVSAPKAFPSGKNFINILNQGALYSIIACGLTAVVIVGEFDMSFAYLASYAGVLVTGYLTNQHLPIPVAIMITLLICLVIGVVNGVLITKLKVNSVIATIGSGGIILGMNYLFSNGAPIVTGIPDAFLKMTKIRIGNVVPINIVYMLVIVAILWCILNLTELGQKIQAVGGNAKAAELSGINTSRIKIAAFCICSVCAGITGTLLASMIGSGTTNAADSYMMDSFAAVFLGSATLKDGEVHILGTLIGVFLVRIGFNGMSILGVDTYFQYIFRGAILVAAVALSTLAREQARK